MFLKKKFLLWYYQTIKEEAARKQEQIYKKVDLTRLEQQSFW